MEKAIIYLRVSTKGKDQNEQLQKPQCVDFCKRMNFEVVDIIPEKGSAYKLEKIRPEWIKVQERAKKEKLNIIIWKYDRCFRNRKEFFDFMKVMFEVYGKKVYSVTEPSIISFWDMMDKSHSDNPIFNEFLKGLFKAIWDLMIQQAGEQAEEESKKKSERVKLAVKRICPKCNTQNESNSLICINCGEDISKLELKSYKGKKWGRKAIKIDERIIKLSKEGKSMRDICKEVYYWDKSHHKKFVSLGYVQGIIASVH